MVYLLLYVDDIILTTSSVALLQQIISTLKREFTMKDLGLLHHFMGVSIQHQADGLFLTQHQFTLNILECVGMMDCKPISTPMDTQAKVSAEFMPPIADLTHFRGLTGALQYLAFTCPVPSRPVLAYTVQQICLHVHDPRESHLITMKCTLHYLWGTLDYGLLL
jgi:hypothetical protein